MNRRLFVTSLTAVVTTLTLGRVAAQSASEEVLPNAGHNVYPVANGRLVNFINQSQPPLDARVVGYQMRGSTVLDNTIYPIDSTDLGYWINHAQFVDAVEEVIVYWI